MNQRGFAPILIVWIVIGSLLTYVFINGKLHSEEKPRDQLISEIPGASPSFSPSPQTNLSSTVSSALVDSVVDCNIDYLSTERIKKSECDKSFACQLGDEWTRYTSREQCTKDQQSYLVNHPDLIAAEMTRLLEVKNQACGWDGEKSTKLGTNECTSAISAYATSLKGLLGSYGTFSNTFLDDKIFELEQKQRKLDQQIQEIGDCNRTGGRWDGSWCNRF